MLDVRVLGPVEARDAWAPIRIGSPIQRALLAALAREPGRTVSSDQLAAVVWGDAPPGHVPGALKSHVSRLRATLGRDVVAARSPGYVLTVPPDRVDAHRFERGLASAGSARELERVLALWRGTPFGELADHPFFAGEVARLGELRAHGRQRWAQLLRAAGRSDEAVAALEALVADEPLREPAWIALLETLHATGRQADATMAARRYREHVAAVGLEPSRRFAAVEHGVFTATPDAGGGGGPSRPGLPSSAGGLVRVVGRDRERERVEELVATRRLVTLVGPGGVGKTTLALEVARDGRERFPDGVRLASLAEVDEPTAVVAAVARAVGAPTTDPLDRAVREFLAGRRALLVLDNAEHVHAEVAALARELAVAGGPHLLATSRRPLGVPGEVVVDVGPLDRPAALALFRERARDAGAPLAPDQEALAAAVCDRLDRLPLALEMAAGRLRGLGLADLAARLDERLRLLRAGDDAGRHRTLGEVVAWSYELLDGPQRSLFEQLSVFAGPFDLVAAEAVCRIEGDCATAVADLVDRSLVRVDPAPGRARYRLLETVRAFAAEGLTAAGGESAVVERFVAHHVGLAERVATGLRGPDEAAWAARFRAQTPNLEAAHGRALETGALQAAARLATAPYVLVYHRLRADLGAWAEATLPALQGSGDPRTPAVAAVVALNRLHRGDPDGAAVLLADLPDDPLARHGHEVLGDLHVYRGELDASLRHARRAEALAHAAGDRFTAMHARVGQALALGYAGDTDGALALLDRTRGQAAALGSPLLAAWFDYTEGELLADAEPARALALLDGAVAAADAADWRLLAGVGRLTASSLRARAADPVEALPAFDRLIRHWDELGDRTHQWTTLRNLVELLTRVGAAETAAWLLGAVATAPTPTYGSERRRLDAAAERLRGRLGRDFEPRVRAGRTSDQRAAVAVALDVLAELRRGGQAPAG